MVDLDEGDAVTFTAGKEVFTPIKFHTFEVGPFAATVRVRAGESGAEALARARVAAHAAFASEYVVKLDSFLDRVRGTSDRAEGKRG